MMDEMQSKAKEDVLKELMDMGDSTEGQEIGEGIKIVIEAASKEEAQAALEMAQEKVDAMPEDGEEMEAPEDMEETEAPEGMEEIQKSMMDSDEEDEDEEEE